MSLSPPQNFLFGDIPAPLLTRENAMPMQSAVAYYRRNLPSIRL